MALCVGLGSLLGLFAEHFYRCMLLVNFKAQYFWLAVGLSVLFVGLKRWKWMGFCLLLAGWNAWYVLPWVLPQRVIVWSGESMRIMSANLLNDNPAHQAFIDYVLERDPDVLVAQEVRRRWPLELQRGLSNRYPHIRIESGLAVFSKQPIDRLRFEDVGVPHRPVVMFETTLHGWQVSMMGIHVHAPRKHSWKKRNLELANAAKQVTGFEHPVIVLGDLNSSMWDPAYQRFETVSQLRSARRGAGILPTYTKFRKYVPNKTLFTWLGVPIDHVLVSDDFVVKQFQTGPPWGSDHLPVEVELQFRLIKN